MILVHWSFVFPFASVRAVQAAWFCPEKKEQIKQASVCFHLFWAAPSMTGSPHPPAWLGSPAFVQELCKLCAEGPKAGETERSKWSRGTWPRKNWTALFGVPIEWSSHFFIFWIEEILLCMRSCRNPNSLTTQKPHCLLLYLDNAFKLAMK